MLYMKVITYIAARLQYNGFLYSDLEKKSESQAKTSESVFPIEIAINSIVDRLSLKKDKKIHGYTVNHQVNDRNTKLE